MCKLQFCFQNKLSDSQAKIYHLQLLRRNKNKALCKCKAKCKHEQKLSLYYSKGQEGKQKVKNNSTNNVKLFAYLVIKTYYLCFPK